MGFRVERTRLEVFWGDWQYEEETKFLCCSDVVAAATVILLVAAVVVIVVVVVATVQWPVIFEFPPNSAALGSSTFEQGRKCFR